MDYKYIVAPSRRIAHYYAGKIGVNHRLVRSFSDRCDIHNLRGLDRITITVVNHYECEQEILDFLSILSTTKSIKLEFENV